MASHRRKNRPGLRPLSLAVLLAFPPLLAANPTGPTVVHGAASVLQSGNLLQVTNTPNAIINWQSFSIGANEITRFIQQSQSSSVLNRVVGAGGAIDPSVILGSLQSNGRVFLVNPSGILFGAGAQVDVAGIVASSLNLSNADFLANRLRFGEAAGAGSVVNQGNIRTGAAGEVYLVGPAVTNQGIITSPQGEVVLAAGNRVELVNPGTPNLRVEIAAPRNEALNLGQVVAESGRIGIYAGLVRNTGTVSASSAVAEGGRIVLKATDRAELAGAVRADGVSGGSVQASAGGDLRQGGVLSATGTTGDGGTVSLTGHTVMQMSASRTDAGSAGGAGGAIVVAGAAEGGLLLTSGALDASGERGGDIRLLGERVTLWGARVDASGASRGGTILAGGDYQGANAAVLNSRAATVTSSVLNADAREAGDGGRIIVWSDGETRYFGSASVRGGAASGDGGLIEVSGKERLSYGGTANAAAPNGRPGTLLLDPRNLTIGEPSTSLTVDPVTSGGGFSLLAVMAQ